MSRFLRRGTSKPAALEDTEPLPPVTCELLTRPSAETKVPPQTEHTEEQKSKLAELQEFARSLHAETLKPEDSYWQWEERWLNEDGLYARYLRAAKWDMANAQKRIRGTLEWRREFKPDLIVPDDVKIEGETGKHVISGFDRQGRVVLYLRPGRENTKPSDRQIKYLVWSLERAIDFLPAGQEKLCLVIDYKSATQQNNPSFSTSLKVLNILQNHYVERLGRACVSSVPWFINVFFTAIGPFLDPITKDKIRFNANLTEFIPTEQLDSEWKGGRYNYSFDADKYWATLLDFCGIAPDGTRTHESHAKTSPELAQAGEATSEGASPSQVVDEVPTSEVLATTSGEGQTFSTFMAHAAAPAGVAFSAGPASSAIVDPSNDTSVATSRDASLSTTFTEPEPELAGTPAVTVQGAVKSGREGPQSTLEELRGIPVVAPTSV